MRNKKLQEEDKYLKELESTIEEIVNHFTELGEHAVKVYNDKRDDDEPNLYQEVINIIRKLNPESINNFKRLMEKAEPDIDKKKAIVQQYLMTIRLIEYLLYIKGKYNLDKLDISTILMGIPYYSDNKVWLNQMSKFVIPTLLKYKIL